MKRERIREALLDVWGHQACRNPADWPDTLERFMKAGGGKWPRAALKPAVDEAVEALFLRGNATDKGAGITDDEVWRAFSRLDPEHRGTLAQWLRDEGARS
jgi:hypothetical protein